MLEIILVRSSIQADPGFFAHKEKPDKCGKFSPCFHGFSRNSWKARRARTLLAFLGLFLASPHVQKRTELKPGILPGKFWAPFCRESSLLF